MKTKRSIKELLVLLLDYYTSLVSGVNKGEIPINTITNPYSGLCYATQVMKERNIITYTEERRIDRFIEDATKNRNVFYTALGTKTNNHRLFTWKPKNYKARINFLKKHIDGLK